MKNVLKQLAKSFLIPEGLAAGERKTAKENFWIGHDNTDNLE